MAVNNTQKILINSIPTDFSNDLPMAAEISESHLLIVEDDRGRKEINLDRPVYSIGRDRECDIRLNSQFVSRRHATLVRLPRDESNHTYYYRIVDGDAKGKPSANGLMINGRKLPAQDLKNEDEIVFGPQVRAIYYLLKDSMRTGQTDSTEYDITLINPGMTEETEE
ncbi:FHA domain-containing protein [Calothrix sp. UHCC 0171]|uniref:FHA domain-containing protein n=1 Tax=Calothrix sp. UHCC 0171 TaxID=3110245 RepID=UPI002B2122A6|nr:FHA domain-containing protein [Calothrix sp. UHCC 0171]MEA5574246.1 FHA domain-containing protein [Calothrix sp. UHCC 0171]